ncbi:MAG: MFS transporter [Thermoactinomyces sp.]
MSQQKQDHTYRSILRENKSFRKLFYALSVSTLGDWFYNVALMGLMYASTNSPLMVSLILLSGALPRLLFSPLAGAFIDRFNKKRLWYLPI